MRLPTLVSPKTDFAISRNQYAQWASDPRSSIEYLVIHAPVGTIRSVMEGAHPNKVSRGIAMAIDIIRKLRILHIELGIIHGNVNPDTVVFDKTTGGHWTYLLTGFQRATYAGESRTRSEVSDCSSWLMWKDGPGFADDVYMALFTAGAVASQQGVYNVFLRTDARTFHATWFKTAGVHSRLRAAIERVRSVASKTEKPDYDGIIRILSQISV
jgi:hypothetical protein